MKPCPHTSVALFFAVLIAIAWFALWLMAFEPASTPWQKPVPKPSVAYFPIDGNELSTLQAPTLFALPSKEGFSGTFPDERINLSLSLERPYQPENYLPRPVSSAPEQDQSKLIEAIQLPKSELPSPGVVRTAVQQNPKRIELFFSPELKGRAEKTGPLSEIQSLSTTSLRIQLTVRPDGTVAQAFFDKSVEQPALLTAVRRIRFAAAPKTASGWLDIRYTPSAGEPN